MEVRRDAGKPVGEVARVGETVTRRPHKPEIPGSIPGPATATQATEATVRCGKVTYRTASAAWEVVEAMRRRGGGGQGAAYRCGLCEGGVWHVTRGVGWRRARTRGRRRR